MSLVRLDNVSKAYAGDFVLEGVSVQINEKDKIGLIGRNGTGKTTIFRLITGETQPESGSVERKKRVRIAYLAQLPDVPSDTPLLEIVMHAFEHLREMERELARLEERMTHGDEAALEEYGHLQDQFSVAGGYEFPARAKQVLTGLGFAEEEFDLPFMALSGGQRTRLMLALLLLQDADLLLLDEPENHLDLQAREWLEEFLQGWQRAYVIISHDRRMLNVAAETIVELDQFGLRVFPGNYDAYVTGKQRLTEDQQKAYERQQEYIQKEMTFINRFRYKATKAKQVQSRIARLDKLERLDAPNRESGIANFRLGEVVRSGQVVLEAKHLSMGYDNLPLYEDVSFTVERGQRVGIIGPNGAGKTTMLRHISGRLPEATGEVTLGHKVSLGFFDQQHGDLNPAADVLSEASAAKPAWTPEQVRTFLGRFLFIGDDVFKPVSGLSGGERGRLSLAKLILSNANLILLDEPTNHLDIASREALEGALTAYPGTIIMVSHDRELLDRLADKLVIVSGGKAEVHLGNYTHYRWKQSGGGIAPKKLPPAETSPRDDALRIRSGNKSGKKQRERLKADERERRKQRKRLDELETQIRQVEDLIADYEVRFNEADPTDHERLRTLTEEFEGYKRDLRELYAEWEDVAANVEART